MIPRSLFNDALKLEKVFSDPRYAALRDAGDRITAYLDECRAFHLAGQAISALLLENPNTKFLELQTVLKAMRKAKKRLQEEVRDHKGYLKVTL